MQLRKWKWFMGDSKSLCVTLQNTRRSLTRWCGILCVFRLGIAERYDVWASSPPPGHRDKKSRQKLNSPDLDLAGNFIPQPWVIAHNCKRNTFNNCKKQCSIHWKMKYTMKKFIRGAGVINTIDDSCRPQGPQSAVPLGRSQILTQIPEIKK